MKIIALLLGIGVACAGCGSRQAAYVRDPSHHCKVFAVSQASSILVGGAVHRYHGYTSYHCDNSVVAIIYDDEEQP